MKSTKTILCFTIDVIVLSLVLLTCNFACATSTPYSYPYPPPDVPDFIVTCTNNKLNVIITNQPFTPFNETLLIGNNNNNVSLPVSLYYNVQVKEHSDYNWTDMYTWGSGYPTQSKTNSTVVMYSLGKGVFENVSYGSQVDFQVQAMVGSWVYQQVFPPINPHFPFPYEWTFYGTLGNWSETQTITIENGATSTTLPSTPTSTPAVPEFPPLAILPLLLTMLSVAVIVRHRKTANQTR